MVFYLQSLKRLVRQNYGLQFKEFELDVLHIKYVVKAMQNITKRF